MKVLVINTVSFQLNGITSVIMNYYRFMDKTKFKIDIVAITEPYETYYKEITELGSNIYILLRRKGAIKYFLNLVKIIKNENYDVIHVHGNSSLMIIELLAALVSGVKSRIVHSHNTTCNHKLLHNMLWFPFIKLSTIRLACGQKAGEWLYRNKYFDVINNGIDINKFRFSEEIRKEYRTKLGLTNEKLIGHIGNFIEQKNHVFVVEMFEMIIKNDKRVKLLLIGDGIKHKEIEKLVVDKGLSENVIFIPRTIEINKLMMAMDIFVLPSLYEGFPVVSIEAQASDLPCVFSDTISTECNLTGNIQFLSLDDKEKWRNVILSIIKEKRDSEKAINILSDKGFDIVKNASILKSIYLSEANTKN